MNFLKNKLPVKIFIFFIFLADFYYAIAQDDSEPFNDKATESDPPAATIDDYIIVLVIIAVLFAAYFFYSYKKTNERASE